MDSKPQVLVGAISRSLADSQADVVIVACSGGADSLALAKAAERASRARHWRVRVHIVDHGLQPDSSHIAHFAADECRAMGINDIEVERVSVEGSGGIEAAARNARYAALGRAANRYQAPVLLGHTADDQAETVLLGVLRGANPRSLAGMPAQRGPYRRPFLHLRRAVVREAYPELTAWEDPHNDDRRFTRSRIRHEILPFLSEHVPGDITAALARTADQIREESEAVDSWANTVTEACRTTIERTLHADASAGSVLPVEVLAAVPRAVTVRVLRNLIVAAGAPSADLGHTHLATCADLVYQWRGQGPRQLPGKIVVQRINNQIVIRHNDTQTSARTGEENRGST